MTENEVNIYSIAYRDCKEVAESIDVNEECGKANTILFYMDEILDALKIASELQAIGTIEEFKALKEKEERFDRNIKMFNSIGLEIRAKAIDEFAERLCSKIKAEIDDCADELEWIDEIAEEMRGAT